MHSLIKTALHLIEHGNRDLKGRAEKWLGWLDMEKCLQAAMMADASDQAMQFTRILVTEGTDPASMTNEANVFLQVVQSLFEAEPPCMFACVWIHLCDAEDAAAARCVADEGRHVLAWCP